MLRIGRMGWLSSAVEQGPATLQCNDLKDAVLHIEEQVISAAHAVVGEELATNSEAEGNQPLQGAGNLERLVWLALLTTTPQSSIFDCSI